MIRVSIITDTAARARYLSELLADDERLEVVEARATVSGRWGSGGLADVIVAAGIDPERLPEESNVVLLEQEGRLEPRGQNVRAWLPPQISAQELGAAIVAAASGLTVLTEAQATRWLPPRAIAGLDRYQERLTARETQVLRMLAHGMGNKEIAGQLRISDHTAKFHVAQILAKLNAGSRTEAVAIAIRRGLVPI